MDSELKESYNKGKKHLTKIFASLLRSRHSQRHYLIEYSQKLHETSDKAGEIDSDN